MADILGDHRFDSFLAERAESILLNFDRCYFQGGYYSSKGIVDDRANAMAVLAGLCKEGELSPNSHHTALGFQCDCIYGKLYSHCLM